MTSIAPASLALTGAARRHKIAYRTAVMLAVGSVICAGGCSKPPSKSSYHAVQARIGASSALLSPNSSVADFRWSGDVVLAGGDAAPGEPATRPAKPDIRFGVHAAVWVNRD